MQEKDTWQRPWKASNTVQQAMKINYLPQVSVQNSRACAGKWNLTDTSEKLQNHKNHFQKSATLRTWSQVSAQFLPSLRRKTIPNRHLQKSNKINKKVKFTRLARSVWIRFAWAHAGKWYLTDTSKKASEEVCFEVSVSKPSSWSGKVILLTQRDS